MGATGGGLAELGPETVQVDCSGTRHRVTWEAGRLSFPDHDVEAERAYAALGGEAAACLTVDTLWRLDPNSWSRVDGALRGWPPERAADEEHRARRILASRSVGHI
ncbi:MAG TPA: hypothetical protein VM840_13285 [Actinomycetota bacterium]|nr:hypothetical protein [Actinomycetota bacterium]